MGSLAKDLGIISLAAVSFAFAGCGSSVDVNVETVTTVITAPKLFANNEKQEIWHVPTNQMQFWMEEYMKKEENLHRKVAFTQPFGVRQTGPGAHITTSFIVGIDK